MSGKFICSNCGNHGDNPAICTKCFSKNIAAPGQKVAVTGNKQVMTEGKEGWKSFHSQEVTKCTKCGSNEFVYNYKRKEKTCKKCGEIFSLPRRGT